MLGASLIGGFRVETFWTLGHAVPSSVVSEVARRASIDASRSGVISELIPAAARYTFAGKDIAVSEASRRGTSCYATLGGIFSKVIGRVNHRACQNTGANCCNVWMFEAVKSPAAGTHRNTRPCRVIRIEINNIKSSKDSLRTCRHASSVGIINEDVGFPRTRGDASPSLVVSVHCRR